MTDRLDEIRKRLESKYDVGEHGVVAPVYQMHEDIAYLLAEVERLNDILRPKPAKDPPEFDLDGAREFAPYEAWALDQAKLLDDVEGADNEKEMRKRLKTRFEIAAKHGLEVKFEPPAPDRGQ